MTSTYPFIAKYGKTIVAFLLPVYAALVAARTGDHHVDPTEACIIIVAALNGALVYLVPMAPGWRWGKSVLGAALAAFVALQTVIGGGVDLNETYLVIGAIVTALGIPIAPAVSEGAARTASASGDVVVHVGADRS
jgi:hypothetical protein